MHEKLEKNFLAAITALAADPRATTPHVLDQARIRVQFFLDSRQYLGLARDALFEENARRRD